jgi:hypothetical protein
MRQRSRSDPLHSGILPVPSIGRSIPDRRRRVLEGAFSEVGGSLVVGALPGTADAESEADRLGAVIARTRSTDQKTPIPRFDFRGVRIHDPGLTPSESRRANVRAMTFGRDVYLADGAARSDRTDALLAHELVHVLQQARTGTHVVQRKTLDEEIDDELKATTYDAKTLDPTHEEYAQSLQKLGFNLAHDASTGLRTRPADPKLLPEWERRFEKANLLAKRILLAGPKVIDKDVRAGMIAQDLASVGLIDKAMAIAGSLTAADQKGFVYAIVIKSPGSVTAAHLTTISAHYAKANPKLADHPVMTALRDRSGTYSKALGAEKVNAVLGAVITTYAADPELIQALSEVLIFDKPYRAAFATWIRAQGKAELLFRILRSKWFADEDQAEREEFQDAAGKAVSLDRETDQGWVISEKQRYYVDYLITLGATNKVVIPRPRDLTFASIKAWLDANTELVAQALKAAGDPAKAAQVYREIADVFFYHVTQAEGDVKPDLAGKLAKLDAATPQKMRLKSDCDVLASYALRLLTASGFTPVGYLAIVPTDTSRQAHVVGIVQQGTDQYVISNKTIQKLATAAANQKDLLIAARDYALAEGYSTPNPTSFAVYYAAAGAKGEISQKLIDSDASLRRTDVEPSQPATVTP